jgi:tRNA U34 5-methylaminomethyl-2-thiouridine-forming methyltransferase MnmC
VLEIGFGTGLNMLLLADLKHKTGSRSEIHFQSIEAWPLPASTAAQLNYRNHLQNPLLNNWLMPVFEQLQTESADYEPEPGFRVRVHHGFFENFKPANIPFGFVFHDPFSPDVNPELWTSDVFKSIHIWCSDDAVLTTYCAASRARAAMAYAGWYVARAPGALGKREMTIASKAELRLAEFKRMNELRLKDRFYP